MHNLDPFTQDPHQCFQKLITFADQLDQDLTNEIKVAFEQWQHPFPQHKGQPGHLLGNLAIIQANLTFYRHTLHNNSFNQAFNQNRYLPESEIKHQVNDFIDLLKPYFRDPTVFNTIDIWMQHAVLLDQGNESVSLNQVAEDWFNDYEKIATIYPDILTDKCRTDYFSANHRLPARIDVRTGGQRRRGWSPVIYRPHAGYKALTNLCICRKIGKAAQHNGDFVPQQITPIHQP